MSAIAHAAKAHWGYPAHWMERWREQLTITPEFISAHETFMAQVDRKILGFYALLKTPESWRLEHLWVVPEQMGRGIAAVCFAARRREQPPAEPFA